MSKPDKITFITVNQLIQALSRYNKDLPIIGFADGHFFPLEDKGYGAPLQVINGYVELGFGWNHKDDFIFPSA